MENINFLLDIVSKKIDRQVDNWNSLDHKLGLLSGFIATIIGAEVALMFKYLGLNIFSLSIIILFSSLIIALIGLWPKDFLDPIDINEYYTDKYLKNSIKSVKNKSLADFKACYQKNNKILKNKSLFFKLSIIIFVLGIVLLIGGSYKLVVKESIPISDGREVIENMTTDNDNSDDPEEEITPVEPNENPGTPIEKGEVTVKPNDSPGNTMPFGETNGGVKL